MTQICVFYLFSDYCSWYRSQPTETAAEGDCGGWGREEVTAQVSVHNVPFRYGPGETPKAGAGGGQ